MLEYIKNNRIISAIAIVFTLLFILSMFNFDKTKGLINYIKNEWKFDKAELIAQIEKDRDGYRTKSEELQRELSRLSVSKIKIEREKQKLKTELDIINNNIEDLKKKQIIKTGDKREVSKILDSLGYFNNILPCE